MASQPLPQRATRALTALASLSAATPLTIVKISEPISNSLTPSNLRTSDISASSLDTPTPSSLEADLAHYKELFAKLRFSYVEQVTKEKFIRAIVGDPPLIVTPQENADLEAANLEAKAALKALKTDVADTVTQLEARARDLAARHEQVTLDTATLGELPARMADLEAGIALLRERSEVPEGARPELNMPLGKTMAAVERRRDEMRDLDRQLERLSEVAPRKRKETERLQAEVAALEARRVKSCGAAKEAKRRREEGKGSVEDELEAKGRWWRANEVALREVLGLEG